MKASEFYQKWDSTVAEKESSQSVEKLDMFDELDFLLGETPDEAAQTAVQQETCIATETSKIDIGVHDVKFMKNAESHKVVESNIPLINAIIQFSRHYDYEIKNDDITTAISKMCSKELNYNESILEWLTGVFGILVDCDFDEVLLQYSYDELANICTIYRNMSLSELIQIADHKNADYFDASIIKRFSLEKRDTGVLLHLMQFGKFDREEAIIYTTDCDMFNSYLTLKMSDKYDSDTFNSVYNMQGNMDNYVKSILTENPLSFLGARSDFNEILALSSENDIDVDLAKRYSDCPFLLDVLKASVSGVIDNDVIEGCLYDEDCKLLAQDYGNLAFSKEALLRYPGEILYAKLVYDIKYLNDKNNAKEQLNDINNVTTFGNFANSLYALYYSGVIDEVQKNKFVLGMMLCSDAVEYVSDFMNILKAVPQISFNQFNFVRLLLRLGIQSSVPADIGSLLLYYNGKSVTYLNVQMIVEALNPFLESVAVNLGNDITVKILPNNAGILLCSTSYSEFKNEKNKFLNMVDSICSVDSALIAGADKHVNRYNVVNVINIAQRQTPGSVTDSFKQLLLLPPENYLMYDSLLGMISTKFTEFSGLCMCADAIQCLKLFNSMLGKTNRAEIQVEFLKMYLKFKFGDRISFDRYNPEDLNPITVVEVKGSYIYNSVSLSKVLGTLDNFVNDLNSNVRIICRFDNTGVMRFGRN